MLNKYMVAGRLTANPEIQTIGENRLCKFTIACDRPKKKDTDKPETDFFNCAAWNRNADVIVDWFGKGDLVTLVGSVHIDRFVKDGQKRTSTEITVEPSGIVIRRARTTSRRISTSPTAKCSCRRRFHAKPFCAAF